MWSLPPRARAWLAGTVLAGTACHAPGVPARAPDWLIDPQPYRAALHQDGNRIVLANGLVARTFVMEPNLACVGLDQLSSGQAMLRAVESEAVLVVDGTELAVGGLVGQPDRAFLREEWLSDMTADPGAFHLRSWRQEPVEERVAWRRERGDEGRPWPPAGVHLVFELSPP